MLLATIILYIGLISMIFGAFTILYSLWTGEHISNTGG